MYDLDEILKLAIDKTLQNEQTQKILQPYTYTKQIPDKTFRTQLSHAFNYWLEIPEDTFNEIEDIMQVIYSSGLLIDDVEDNSTIRKGLPAAHCIYGMPSTINAAYYAVFLCLEKVHKLGHPKATEIFTEHILQLHRGQGIDLYWRDNFICPSEKDYKIMTVSKMGGTFMMTVRLMQLFSKNKENYYKMTAIISLYYQILDDYCNTNSHTTSDDKTFAEDLTDGKFGFPIIHAVQQQNHDKQLMLILRQRTTNVHMKKYCIALLEKLGSFDYTRKVLASLEKEARKEIRHLGGNPHLQALLDTLQTWKTLKPK